MTNCNCNTRCSCIGIGVVVSIIIGIVTAFLTFTAAITVTPAFLWVLFGIAVVYLAIVLGIATLSRGSIERRCICSIVPTALLGIIGTILVSVILLGITFAATSVLGAIITGLLLLFFTLIITSVACLTLCIANCNEN